MTSKKTITAYLFTALLLSFSLCCFVACENDKPAASAEKEPTIAKKEETAVKIEEPSSKKEYDLTVPDYICELPRALVEISALTYDASKDRLLAVNDERGVIFILNMKECTIDQKFDFAKRGDYEGIEMVGNMIYVTRANGDVYAFNKDYQSLAEQIKTPLSVKNDVEGLGYDKSRNELILACKASPNLDKKSKNKNTKAFYAFSLDTKTLDSIPRFVISDQSLTDFFNEKMELDEEPKAKAKLLKRLTSFSPSAIAKHPIEDSFYILSSVGRLLIIVNETGGIEAIEFLNYKLYAQPEGICFTPDGTLYISNEGRSSIAKVYKFDYK